MGRGSPEVWTSPGMRGDNVITVIAIDEAGNSSTAETTTLFIAG